MPRHRYVYVEKSRPRHSQDAPRRRESFEPPPHQKYARRNYREDGTFGYGTQDTLYEQRRSHEYENRRAPQDQYQPSSGTNRYDTEPQRRYSSSSTPIYEYREPRRGRERSDYGPSSYCQPTYYGGEFGPGPARPLRGYTQTQSHRSTRYGDDRGQRHESVSESRRPERRSSHGSGRQTYQLPVDNHRQRHQTHPETQKRTPQSPTDDRKRGRHDPSPEDRGRTRQTSPPDQANRQDVESPPRPESPEPYYVYDPRADRGDKYDQEYF